MRRNAMLILFALAATLWSCEPVSINPHQLEALPQPSWQGPRNIPGASTEVWAVTNAWSDTGTPAAREAGIAWGADSGLSWEQKYQRWVAGARMTDRNPYGTTFVIATPYGERAFAAPTLECAEVALLLRVTFSSWYHLPFFLQGWDAQAGRPLFAGHFGFVDSTGARVSPFPRFRNTYADYEDRWSPGDPWPMDESLRRRRLGDDDEVVFLENPDGSVAGAGAYFDELFLNKRTGYFLRLVLLYFGSQNLADGSNMFHIQADAIAPGDVLLHRWQKQGIGHTIPIMRVQPQEDGLIAVDVATGTMPRRQPIWDDTYGARYLFTSNDSGGPGETSDGDLYAAIGGGLRRWRTAELRVSTWYNEVPASGGSVYLSDDQLEAISARPARFNEILVQGSPAQQRAVLLDRIEAAREHLHNHPASCMARTRREDAFESLYFLSSEYFGQTREQVDADYRVFEDHVFAELVYGSSKTCCWNASTAGMADIILEHAMAEQNGGCVEPTVFRAEAPGGTYDRWKTFATELGRGDEWLDWSEGEPCPQRNVLEDVRTARGPSPWCADSDTP